MTKGAQTRDDVLHLVLECDGALDAQSAAEVKRQALERIDGSADVVIDLRTVEFVDSVGIGVLVSLYKTARRCGRRTNFIGARPGVLRVLKIIRLDEIFELHSDLESAASALRF
jgi:anti-anti-sigma factor